jgi:hypothetical protein
MMISTREQALTGLFSCLQGLIGPQVKRNEALPSTIPPEGLVILRDGQPGEPEILLSPTRYIYQHKAEVEVLVQEADQSQRDAKLDALLVAIGETLATIGTLGDTVDVCHPDAPELLQEHVEGAPTVKAAVIPVILEYSTLNPLQ